MLRTCGVLAVCTLALGDRATITLRMRAAITASAADADADPTVRAASASPVTACTDNNSKLYAASDCASATELGVLPLTPAFTNVASDSADATVAQCTHTADHTWIFSTSIGEPTKEGTAITASKTMAEITGIYWQDITIVARNLLMPGVTTAADKYDCGTTPIDYNGRFLVAPALSGVQGAAALGLAGAQALALVYSDGTTGPTYALTTDQEANQGLFVHSVTSYPVDADKSSGVRTWLGGMRLEVVAAVATYTAGGDTSKAGDAAYRRGDIEPESFCKGIYTALLADSTYNAQYRPWIGCASTVASGASSTAKIDFLTEYDYKFVNAWVRTLDTGAAAILSTDAASPGVAKGSLITVKRRSNSDAAAAAVDTPSAVGEAILNVTRVSGTWGAGEACKELLKVLTKRDNHSVWQTCAGTDTADVSVVTLAFWEEEDIVPTLRNIAAATIGTTIQKAEPVSMKGTSAGKVTGLGVGVLYTFPSISIKVAINGSSAGATSTNSANSIQTASSACAELEKQWNVAASGRGKERILYCADPVGTGVTPDLSAITIKIAPLLSAPGLKGVLTKGSGRGGDTDQKTVGVLAGTTGLYQVTYAITAVSGVVLVAHANGAEGVTVLSPCEWGLSAATNEAYCTSTAGAMTMSWTSSQDAKTGMQEIASHESRTKVAKAQPTSATDVDGAAVAFVTVTYTAANSAAAGWTNDSTASLDKANSPCAAVVTNNAIYCDCLKASGSTMTLMYRSTADFISDGKTNADKTDGTAEAKVQVLTMTGGQFYDSTYTITLADGTDPYTTASTGAFDLGTSGCKDFKSQAANAVYCTSTTGGSMTLTFPSAVLRETDGIKIAQSASDVSGVTAVAIASFANKGVAGELVPLEYTATKDTDGTEWTAANHDANLAGSACKDALTTMGAATNKVIYCDSGAASGSTMTLKFFSAASALTSAKTLSLYKSGNGEKAVRAFRPAGATWYSVEYSVTAKAKSDGTGDETLVADVADAHSSGCGFLSRTKQVACVGTSTETAVQYFVTAADRLTDMVANSKKPPGSKVAHVVPGALADLDQAGSYVTIQYAANNDKGDPWAKAANHSLATGTSACKQAGTLTKCVYCDSATGAGSVATFKWVAAVDAKEQTVADYAVDAQTIAGKVNVDSSQIFAPESDQDVLVESSFSIQTTTAKPERRQLENGDKDSTGGFGGADSWCKFVKPAAPNAVFCVSDASSVTLTHVKDAGADTCSLGASDTFAVHRLTTAYASLNPTIKMSFSLTVKKDLKANALCSKWKGAGILNVASCSHDKVEIPKERRRLTTASVTVTLGLLTQGDLTAAETAYNAIDWAKSFKADVDGTPGPPVSEGGSGPTVPTPTPVAPTPGAPTPETPTPKEPSSAALRVVGVVVLAGFLAV